MIRIIIHNLDELKNVLFSISHREIDLMICSYNSYNYNKEVFMFINETKNNIFEGWCSDDSCSNCVIDCELSGIIFNKTIESKQYLRELKLERICNEND